MASPLRELLAQFGFQFDQAAAAQATQSVAGVIGAVQSLGRTLLAGAFVQGIVRFTQHMIDVGSELADTSAQLGISATELTEWRYAARLAGVDASQMNAALARTALAAQRGSPVLRRLGVQTRDAGGNLRRTADIFEDAGVALGALENETQRTALATQLFGRSGRQLIPMFRAGRNGIRALRAEVRRLYGTDLEQLAQQADAAGDAQDRLSLVWDAAQTRLSLFLLPALTAGIESLMGWAGGAFEAARSSSFFEAALAILGVVAVGAALATIGVWGPTVAMFALVATVVGLVVFAVDDLITLFRGGRSVIGEFIDSLFGVGAAAEFVQHLQRQWQMLTDDIQLTIDTFREFLGLSGSGQTASGDQVATTRGVGAGGIRADGTAAVGVGAPAAVSAPRPAVVRASRSTTVGTIQVQGTADPLETARRVREEIERAGADDADQAVADLVPEGA